MTKWHKSDAGRQRAKIHDRKFYDTVRRTKPLYVALKDAKYRAKRKGIPFSVTIDDIVQPTHCPILGIELDYVGTKSKKPNSASLDRIVPELGYVKNNVIVISWRANKIKTNASIDELCKIAEFYKRFMDVCVSG